MHNTRTRTRNPNFLVKPDPIPDPKSKSPTRHGLVISTKMIKKWWYRKSKVWQRDMNGVGRCNKEIMRLSAVRTLYVPSTEYWDRHLPSHWTQDIFRGHRKKLLDFSQEFDEFYIYSCSAFEGSFPKVFLAASHLLWAIGQLWLSHPTLHKHPRQRIQKGS